MQVISVPAQVRRPADLARLLVVVVIGALVFAAGNLAAQTTTGLQSDIVQATRLLPSIIVVLLTAIGGTFAVLLPAAFVILGLLVTNSFCWARYERFGLGRVFVRKVTEDRAAAHFTRDLG